MNFKERYEQYKQRKEAQAYFRQNSDAFLKPADYVKIVLVCLGIGLAGGFVLYLIRTSIGVNFSFFYLIFGYAMARGITAITHYPNNATVAIGVICYLIGLASIYVFYFVGYFGISMFFNLNVWSYAIRSFMSQSLISWLFVALGGYEIYYLTR